VATTAHFAAYAPISNADYLRPVIWVAGSIDAARTSGIFFTARVPSVRRRPRYRQWPIDEITKMNGSSKAHNRRAQKTLRRRIIGPRRRGAFQKADVQR